MSRNKIYDQHDAAFKNVSAFVVMENGERVATVAFKFPADGAGRLYCYFHVIGLAMVRGTANGYGYDKKSAAFADAAAKQYEVKLESWQDITAYDGEYAIAKRMRDCLTDGASWDGDLRNAGFTVLQAV